jgi:peptide/nickel transport system permease protein
MRALFRRPSVWACAVFFAVALFGPAVVTGSPDAIDLAHAYAPPSAAHWFGTGDNGIDLFTALIHGARVAAIVSVCVVAVSASLGGVLGAAAGLWGGRIDAVVVTLCDLLQAFPSVLLNIALLAVVARPGLGHVVLSLAFNGWVLYARLARAEAIALRERELVAAARALGMGELRVLFRHVLPNVVSPLTVQATAGVGGAILMESTLSFLGLGPAKHVSWGALLDQGSGVLLRFPHAALVSGGAIAATVLAFNLAGDALRDALDPRAQRRRRP